jgi:hypothetical protein
MCQVRFDRAFAEAENRGDLPVRPSVGDEVGDTLLRRRQPFLPVRPPICPSFSVS